MKRKILSIAMALVLVLSFGLVTAVPAAAGVGPITFTVTGGIYSTTPTGPEPFQTGDIGASLTGSWDSAVIGEFTATGEGSLYLENPPAGDPPPWYGSTATIDVSGAFAPLAIDFTGTAVRVAGDDITPDTVTDITGTVTIQPDGSFVAALSGSQALGYPVDIDMTGSMLRPITNERTAESFFTIQAAIDDADTEPGDTITVGAGTYSEYIVIDKTLTLEGANAGVPATGARGPESIITAQLADYAVFIIGAETVATFDGFTIDNYEIGGILAGAFTPPEEDPSVVHILNNVVSAPSDIEDEHNNCIQVGDGTTGTIIGNEVFGAYLVHPGWSGSGILVAASSDVLVSENQVYDCEGGIQILGYAEYRGGPAAEDNLIENNLVENCDTGISVQGNSIGTIIRYNDVLNNTDVGIDSMAYDMSWDHSTPSGTQVHYNNIVGNEYGVKSVIAGSHTGTVPAEEVDAENNWWGSASGPEHTSNTYTVPAGTPQGNAVSGPVDFVPWYDTDMTGASFAPVTTDEEPKGDYSSIQAAIDGIGRTTITCAAGTYDEYVNISISLILSGQPGAIVKPSHPVDAPIIGINADGVTVEGFEVAGTGLAPQVWAGIGSWSGCTDVTIQGNTVHDIANEHNGGCGISLWRGNGEIYEDILIEGNIVYNTDRMGIYIGAASDGSCTTWLLSDNITIRGNEVYDTMLNPNDGETFPGGCGGIAIDAAKGSTIEGNTVYDTANTMPGIFLAHGSGPGNQILGNEVYNQAYGIAVDINRGDVNFGADSPTPPEVHFNNIHDNSAYGLIVLNPDGKVVDATNNYWGSASGPSHSPGEGDPVSDNVLYNPWLLVPLLPGEDLPTIFQKTLPLKIGWTLVSVDNWIDPYSAVGANVTLAYSYTPGGSYTEVTPGALVPVDALYLKTEIGGGVGFDYSGGAPVASSKDLVAGWNLISSATEWNARDVLSPLRYIDVGEQQGVGMSTLVSQGYYNQYSLDYYLSTISPTDWGDGILNGGYGMGLSGVTLYPFDGYWVYMNGPKNFGVIPGVQPEPKP